MSLDEALAVYLYLWKNPHRTNEQERIFNAAWGVIITYAEQTIRRESE